MSGSAPTGRRPSSRSAAACCWPRASSGSTAAPGSTPSSSPFRPTGRRRRSCSPRSSSPRRSPRSSPAGRRGPSPSAPRSTEVPDDALVVIVHDAARPLVDDAVIERVLAPLAEGYDGVVPGLPLADTVKRVEGGVVAETVDRAVARHRADAAGVRSDRAAGGLSRHRARSMRPTARRSSRRAGAGSASSTATCGC